MSLRPRGILCTAPRGRLLLHPRRTGSRRTPSDGHRSPARSRTAGRFRPNGRTPALSPACNCRRMDLLSCFLLFPPDGCGTVPALPRQTGRASPCRVLIERALNRRRVALRCAFRCRGIYCAGCALKAYILVSVAALAVTAAGALLFNGQPIVSQTPKGRKFRTTVHHTSCLYGDGGTQSDAGAPLSASCSFIRSILARRVGYRKEGESGSLRPLRNSASLSILLKCFSLLVIYVLMRISASSPCAQAFNQGSSGNHKRFSLYP